MAAEFTLLTKTLYDLHKVQEPTDYKCSPLDKLVVENFDEEQIWQELELQNTAVLKHFKRAIGEAISDDTFMLWEEEEDEEENIDDEQGETDEENDAAGIKKDPPKQSKYMVTCGSEDSSNEDSDLDFDVDTLEKLEKKKKSIGSKDTKLKLVPSEVDDKFFKLSEMESFLDDMDKLEGNEDEDGIDYFHDLPSDEDDDLDLEKLSTKKQKKNAVCILHFFINVLVNLTI